MNRSLSRVARCLAGALVLTASAALADAPPSSPADAKRPPAAASGRLTTVRGVVKSVSATRLAVDTGSAGAPGGLTVQLDDATVVTRLGKSASAKDLQAGDPVTVSYQSRDGKAVARRVWIKVR